MIKDAKRLTLFAGHYGSGKTNIAVNYAYKLARELYLAGYTENKNIASDDYNKMMKEGKIFCTFWHLFDIIIPCPLWAEVNK